METDDLWHKLKTLKGRGRAIQVRNALIEKYLYLVKYYAEKINNKTPNSVELDDLFSAGVLGLIDAINAYDIERGVNFAAYAAPRIRGAIIDGIRTMDWAPRLMRSRMRKLDVIREEVEARLGSPATDDDIRRHMRISWDEYRGMVKKASSISIGRLYSDLGNKNRDHDESFDYADMLEDVKQLEPSDNIENEDAMNNALMGLNGEDRLVVILRYRENMTMKEIAKVIGISQSGVSLLHKLILDRLKTNKHIKNLCK